MHEGIKVLKQTGFIGGRVHKSPNARPRPRYYEMADGSSLPSNIGPDQLKKAIASGAIREVAAPSAVVQPDVPPVAPVAPVDKESYEDARNARRRQAQEDYEAQLTELSRVRNEALAKIEAEEKALENPVEEETVLTAQEALEDLEWALENQNCYLTDHEGRPLQKVYISGGI